MNNLLAVTTPVLGDPPHLQELDTVFSNVFSYALAFGGILFFFVLIIAGYKYLSSGGSPEQLEKAKGMLTYAFYGVVFLALAFLVLRVIAMFTGVEGILDFTIFES